ncbi:MAG: rod-binding protein [Lachnospirales bacterium]
MINQNFNIASASVLQNQSENLINKVKSKDIEEMKEACADFESYFLKMMYNAMEKTIDDSNSFIPKGNGEKIFTDMLIEEQSKMISAGKGIGLADEMFKQMYKEYNLESEV